MLQVMANASQAHARKVFEAFSGKSAAHDGDVELAAMLESMQSCEQLGNALFSWTNQGETLAAILVVIKLDRTGFIWPPVIGSGTPPMVIQRLFSECVKWLDSIPVEFSQFLESSSSSEIRLHYSDWGFEDLGELIGLEHQLIDIPHAPGPEHYDSVDFSVESANDFEKVLESTFAGSKDCLGLRGRRSAQDCLRSHQLSTPEALRFWKLFRTRSEYVGIILCVDHRTQRFWELLYLGVVPKFRRRGFGLAFLSDALQVAQFGGADRMLLGVDSANEYALRLYDDCGFQEAFRRRLHVRFCPSANTK